MTASGQRPVQLEPSWLELLGAEFDKPYMQTLRSFLVEQRKSGVDVYPPGSQIFSALNTTPVDRVRVVILGQDPYHGPNQAHGLCFSVQPGVRIPPSLQNIYRELQDDLGVQMPDHGCLTHWAEQGVLLLNAVLTVEAGKANSHQNRGWEQFTDQVVKLLNDRCENLVFMLWGSYAQRKGAVIDRQRHLVLQAPHPSPLSAYRGFFGCRHFSRTNQYLQQHGFQPIEWQLPGLSGG